MRYRSTQNDRGGAQNDSGGAENDSGGAENNCRVVSLRGRSPWQSLGDCFVLSLLARRGKDIFLKPLTKEKKGGKMYAYIFLPLEENNVSEDFVDNESCCGSKKNK